MFKPNSRLKLQSWRNPDRDPSALDWDFGKDLQTPKLKLADSKPYALNLL